jgi:hypothetical protein
MHLVNNNFVYNYEIINKENNVKRKQNNKKLRIEEYNNEKLRIFEFKKINKKKYSEFD